MNVFNVVLAALNASPTNKAPGTAEIVSCSSFPSSSSYSAHLPVSSTRREKEIGGSNSSSSSYDNSSFINASHCYSKRLGTSEYQALNHPGLQENDEVLSALHRERAKLDAQIAEAMMKTKQQQQQQQWGGNNTGIRNLNAGGGNGNGNGYMSMPMINGSGNASISSWSNTPDEVQKRSLAGSMTVAPSTYSNVNMYSSQTTSGYSNPQQSNQVHEVFDYNQNVDACNTNYLDNPCNGNGHSHGYGPDVGEDADAPVCQCGLPCITLTSRTATNMDRSFYKCPQPKDSGQQCDFFEWADGMGNSASSVIDMSNQDMGSVKDFTVENKRLFGHNTFREGQRECIAAAMRGQDVFCLMPTGGGKSLVYQLPAWCCPGLAVVFSPLVSLMQDQVDALLAIGIRASYLSASRNEVENSNIFEELYQLSVTGGSSNSQDGPIKLLYITPEKFRNSPKMKNALLRLYQKGLLSRFVIDETHCLSEWCGQYMSCHVVEQMLPCLYIICNAAMHIYHM